MNTPNRPDPIQPTTEPTVPTTRRSAVLWLLLALLAAVLIGWYWLGRQGPAPTAVPLPAAPAAIELPAIERTPDPPAAPVRKTAPTASTAAVRPSSSPAVPIPGYRVTPKYPVAALRAGESGTVVLRVHVGVDGLPGEIGFARRSSSRELDRAASEAVKQWRFKPALRKGKPIASVVEIPIDFEPPG